MSEKSSNNEEQSDELRVSQTEANAKSRGLSSFKQMNWRRTLLRIFVVLFILTSAWNFISSVTHFVQAKRTKTWSETTGEVISYNIKTREEHDDHGTTTYYSPTLKYAYKADGQSYEGGHIAYNALEYSTRDAANRVVAQLNADGQIPVYYNPGDPQQSVLVRGVLVSDTAYQRMGLYFVFLMTIATTFGLFLAAERGWTGFKLIQKHPGKVFLAMLAFGVVVITVYEPGIDHDAIPTAATTDTAAPDNVPTLPKKSVPSVAGGPDQVAPLIFLVIYVIGCLWGLTYNIRRFRKAVLVTARVRDTPTTRIKNIGPGFRKIRATLRAKNEPLQNPITGRKCAHYSVEVTTTRGSGDNQQTVTVGRMADSCPVYFEDGTGKLDASLEAVEFVDFDTRSKVIGKNDRNLQNKMRQLFDIDSARELLVSVSMLPVDTQYFAFGHVNEAADGQFILANGPDGSLLTSKDEDTLLDWMDSRFFKAKSYTVLITIAGLAPLGFLISPRLLGFTIFGFTILAVLIATLIIFQRGKGYELTGKL